MGQDVADGAGESFIAFAGSGGLDGIDVVENKVALVGGVAGAGELDGATLVLFEKAGESCGVGLSGSVLDGDAWLVRASGFEFSSRDRLGFGCWAGRRDESGRGRHECVRDGESVSGLIDAASSFYGE